MREPAKRPESWAAMILFLLALLSCGPVFVRAGGGHCSA